jgi:hypothetical protein
VFQEKARTNRAYQTLCAIFSACYVLILVVLLLLVRISLKVDEAKTEFLKHFHFISYFERNNKP